MDAVSRLTKDLKDASATLSRDEARFLVDAYYMMQKDRIRSGSQVRALEKSEEPHSVLSWFGAQSGIMENQIRRALDAYSDASVTGRWLKSLVGIGPVLAAGLLAHISLEPWVCAVAKADAKRDKCNADEPHGPGCGVSPIRTVGHIWRFAGLDPTVTWEKNQKRPWNASLKTLTWKVGESFVKVSGHDEDVYGHLIQERKQQEIANTERGAHVAICAERLEKFKFGADTDARQWNEGRYAAPVYADWAALPADKRAPFLKARRGEVGSGVPMLAPAHIHARAKRWGVKLFLSHFHAVLHRETFGEDAPKPYVITHMGHTDEIRCPLWPF